MQLPVILVVGTLLSTAVALPVPAARPGDGYDGAPPLSKSVVSPPLRSMKQMLGERMKKARFEASNRGSACLEKLYNEVGGLSVHLSGYLFPCRQSFYLDLLLSLINSPSEYIISRELSPLSSENEDISLTHHFQRDNVNTC